MVKRKETVFVGLSGGVDSAVSAALLKEQGFEIVGVFLKTWHPEFLWCNEEGERRDAMRVAARLGIPFLTFDLEKVYKKEVANYMIAEYRAGRTPNPDVMCNREVKFGAFLQKALAMGADYVATGHYAELRKYSKNSPLNPQAGSDTDSFLLHLLRGRDPAKDQSYFLWALDKKKLSKILFPVGHLKKSEVRKLAKKFNLPVSEKKDSQGICFLGEVDLKKFLKHYIKEKKGRVIDEKGNIIGYHEGVTFYTLGERRGFTITKKTPNDKPYYIINKDIKKNILMVSQSIKSHSNIRTNIRIKNTNWISEIPKENKKYTAQIRYHGEFLPCRVRGQEIILDKPVLAAPGQSMVLYDRDVCLGGGVVV